MYVVLLHSTGVPITLIFLCNAILLLCILGADSWHPVGS